MKHLSKFIRFFAVGFTFFSASAMLAHAATPAQQEADALIKEDLANAQVLVEMCPALIGKNAKFDTNIKKMMATYLSDYSDKSASLDSLQKDAEFQTALKESRDAATEIEKAEQKSVCEDVLNFEG